VRASLQALSQRKDALRHAADKGRLYMLVLRRKVGESIVLDGVINISVLAVEGERVKIGISAPADVTIVREELLRIVTDAVNNSASAQQL